MISEMTLMMFWHSTRMKMYMITMERRGRRIMRGHQIIEHLPSHFYLALFLDLVLRVYSTMEHSVWFHRLPFYFFCTFLYFPNKRFSIYFRIQLQYIFLVRLNHSLV